METKVLYTAVMLDMKSKEMLKKEFAHIVPDGWEWIGHHMTIQLGELPGVLKHEMLGKRVNLEVISFGKDDKVMAVGVDGYWSKNKRPHITLAVNRSGGGKPVMSNHISTELWELYKMDTLLSGIVEEYK